jgi:hypothetical protein
VALFVVELEFFTANCIPSIIIQKFQCHRNAMIFNKHAIVPPTPTPLGKMENN